MARVALIVSYSGQRYRGWQHQSPGVPTVQATLEQAIGAVADEPVRVHCAGRTDTGVHATMQVVHFDAEKPRESKAWQHGVNAHLPDDVAVCWAAEVSPEFDARRSATERRYRYFIYNGAVRSAFFHENLAREHRELDAARMHEAAQSLLGERDFSAFRAAGCQSRTPMRNVHWVQVERAGDLVVIDIAANAFLYRMVRNIVGTLAEIGAGERETGWVAELLEARDRTQAAGTLSPAGLYLVDVKYPGHFGIPSGPRLPHLLSR